MGNPWEIVTFFGYLNPREDFFLYLTLEMYILKLSIWTFKEQNKQTNKEHNKETEDNL